MIFMEIPPGRSVEGMDIPAFKTDVKSKKWIYLIAGTHGDEVEGVYVLQKYFEWIKGNNELEELPIIVIPILNIDGYKQGTRVNSHAVDLNRNYPSEDWSSEFKKDKYNPGPKALSEPENKFLCKLFEKYTPGIILSFHTWKPIINFNGDSEDLAKVIAEECDYPISDYIGYGTPGSLGTFVPEKYDNCGVITYECPNFNDHLTLQDIWEENEAGLKKLFTDGLIQKKL
jgi:protein MpaA